jgi:hypothetical protein
MYDPIFQKNNLHFHSKFTDQHMLQPSTINFFTQFRYYYSYYSLKLR